MTLTTIDKIIRENLEWYKENGNDHGDLVLAEEAIKNNIILLLNTLCSQVLELAIWDYKDEDFIKRAKVISLIDELK